MTGGPTVTTFQEFLKRKAGIDPAMRAARQEWLDSLHGLRNTIKDWLKELDPESYLVVQDREFPRLDPLLGGRYDAPGLEIKLGSNSVEVEPVSRSRNPTRGLVSLASWEVSEEYGEPGGWVQLKSSNGYIQSMFRFVPAVGEPVWILMARPSGYRDGPALPLDREQLGLVLQELLS